MNISTNFSEQVTLNESPGDRQSVSTATVEVEPDERIKTTICELGLWLRGVESFFDASNLSFSQNDRARIVTRDFTDEMIVAHSALQRCLQLFSALTRAGAPGLRRSQQEEEGHASINGDESARLSDVLASDAAHVQPASLADPLTDASVVCRTLVRTQAVSFEAWSSIGRMLVRELRRSEHAKQIMWAARRISSSNVRPELLTLTERVQPESLGADLREVFVKLNDLLDQLRFIEASLKLDRPLKQMLIVFTLIHQETRSLLTMIEARALRSEDIESSIFDALDSTAYAIRMELRKALEYELADLSGSRQMPLIYAKVENAHGILRDCFQQSVVALAQVFDDTLDGKLLFQNFQTKLDQSLALRRDLWIQLKFVQRAESTCDPQAVAALEESLSAFREGGLRYLMYKDWESYERFFEEIAVVRKPAELSHVLNRFAAYLETLFGQVNMRAVLSEHAFDYPQIIV
ncbi:MAG: hypothetical protein M3R15_32855 [Acidobacteriota bacterium]|nr:hypothetical protein [Acidobacteriota bacterium]